MPRCRNMAYLHVKTKAMADHLKNLKTIRLAGGEVKVYAYTPNSAHINETNSSTASINGSDKLHQPDGCDSGVNTTGLVSRSHSPNTSDTEPETTSWAAINEYPAAVPTPANPPATTNYVEISAKLKDSFIIPSIKLPDTFRMYYPTYSANICEIAADQILNQNFSAEEFNLMYNKALCEYLEKVWMGMQGQATLAY